MTNSILNLIAASPAAPDLPYGVEETDQSFRKDILAGWLILFAFFGVFGVWAGFAPLHGAVVSSGVVTVEGNRKSVQHLDGGIVKDLRTKEGEHVASGDVLMVLDDTRARAEFDVLAQRQIGLRATEVRLTAEMNHAATLTPSPDIAARLDEPDVRDVWAAQQKQFDSRREALDGERTVLHERINQLKAQITGGQKQIAAYQQQIESVRQELEKLAPLIEKGLITQPRRLQLERSAFGLEGQIGTSTGDVARAKQMIAEQEQKILQLDNDRMSEITKELRDTQAQELEVIPKLENARTALSRMDIRAPYSGKVIGLNVFGSGAVVKPGEKIMDIVPDDDALMIESRIAVDDVNDVHPDMRAEIYFTAYKQRITPMVHGDVTQVSADRLTDSRTGMPYYTALVRVDQKELANLPQVQLYPGMAARVTIPTVERTVLDYLLGPLIMSVNSAFRQK